MAKRVNEFIKSKVHRVHKVRRPLRGALLMVVCATVKYKTTLLSSSPLTQGELEEIVVLPSSYKGVYK